MAQIKYIKGRTGCLSLKGNCLPFYVIGDREWILMDSGSRFDREELFACLEQYHVIIKAVLCSHAHFDHVENNWALQKCFGTEIVMSAFDAFAVRDGLTLKTCFYSHSPEENEKMNWEMMGRADRMFDSEAGEVSVCGESFQILSLPGHAASHMGFVTPDHIAYVGDCLLGQRELDSFKMVYMLSWNRCIETIERLKSSDYSGYILAHSGIYKDIKALAVQNVIHFEERLEEVYKLADRPLTLEQLVSRVVNAHGNSVRGIEKARLFERITRSMVEALVERGKLSMEIQDGILMYVHSGHE